MAHSRNEAESSKEEIRKVVRKLTAFAQARYRASTQLSGTWDSTVEPERGRLHVLRYSASIIIGAQAIANATNRGRQQWILSLCSGSFEFRESRIAFSCPPPSWIDTGSTLQEGIVLDDVVPYTTSLVYGTFERTSAFFAAVVSKRDRRYRYAALVDLIRDLPKVS